MPLEHFQPATQGTLAAGAVVLNVVSLLCCLAVAWLYLKTPKARRSGTSKLVFFLAGASAALALSSAASEAGTSVACFAPPHTCRREHTAAWALLESTHIFLLRCAGAWSAAVALHLIRERLRASKILGYNFVTWQRGYHLLCWVGPAAHMQGCTLVNDWLGPRAASVALYGAVMHGASVGLLARLRHARSPPPGWVQLQVEEQRAVEEQRRGSSLSHTACLLPYCLATSRNPTP
ncbi:hypothetical protein T484DRAFT_1816915 [Baffinella frigidus]|nr:hypothetical protein T484DRAFT_1816915 [Cryptophyta sp. CCMP2293]